MQGRALPVRRHAAVRAGLWALVAQADRAETQQPCRQAYRRDSEASTSECPPWAPHATTAQRSRGHDVNVTPRPPLGPRPAWPSLPTPARSKRSSVDFCRLPLGKPKRTRRCGASPFPLIGVANGAVGASTVDTSPCSRPGCCGAWRRGAHACLHTHITLYMMEWLAGIQLRAVV